MKGVDTIARIRREFFVRGKTIKEIVRELHVSLNTVRKVLRSGATEFTYQREVQPLPKLGCWKAELDRLLAANEAKPARERLTLIRVGASGVHEHRECLHPALRNLSRNRLWALCQELIDAGRIVKCRAKGSSSAVWLDFPDGQFAQADGEGEIRTGARTKRHPRCRRLSGYRRYGRFLFTAVTDRPVMANSLDFQAYLDRLPALPKSAGNALFLVNQMFRCNYRITIPLKGDRRSGNAYPSSVRGQCKLLGDGDGDDPRTATAATLRERPNGHRWSAAARSRCSTPPICSRAGRPSPSCASWPRPSARIRGSASRASTSSPSAASPAAPTGRTAFSPPRPRRRSGHATPRVNPSGLRADRRCRDREPASICDRRYLVALPGSIGALTQE